MKTPVLILAILAGLASNATAAQPEIHCKHFFHGYPTGTPATNDLIIRDCYAMSNNDTTKFADWAAYRLTRHETEPLLDLDRRWRADPWLHESETLEPTPKSQDDYKGAFAAGYDRGHLAPLASFKGSRYASQVNVYSNILPQASALNQGPWQRLERAVRELTKKHDAVYVMTGPIFDNPTESLPNAVGDGVVKIPTDFWKIVCVQDGSTIKVAGYLFSQSTARNAKFSDHVEKIDVIEQKTGLDFLRLLPNAVEATLQQKKNGSWVK